MRIALLETGKLAEEFVRDFGGYPEMFQEWLSPIIEPHWSFQSYLVVDGVFPDRVDDHDAYLITGSRHGVYEDHHWIPKLEAFIRDIALSKAALVGICFGHQIIAQALGGKVEKSVKGWGCGLHDYDLLEPPTWMGQSSARFSIPVSHQDQVVAPPPGAKVLGGNNFCPYGFLQVGENVLSMQCHPEMTRDFASRLIEWRRGSHIDHALADIGQASLRHESDAGIVAQWVRDFLDHQVRVRQAAE